jgi:hypothetical protein
MMLMKTPIKKTTFRDRSGIAARQDTPVMHRTPTEEDTSAERAIQELKQESLSLSHSYENYREAFGQKLRNHSLSMFEFKCRLHANSRVTNTNYEMLYEQVEQKLRKMKIRLEEYQPAEKSKWEMFVRAFGFELEQTGKTIARMIKMNL